MSTIHRIPGTSVLRERERIEGGIADPNSEAALAICRAHRDRYNYAHAAKRASSHRIPRVDPDKDQRTAPIVGRKGDRG